MGAGAPYNAIRLQRCISILELAHLPSMERVGYKNRGVFVMFCWQDHNENAIVIGRPMINRHQLAIERFKG
jgi:hypothetical protein